MEFPADVRALYPAVDWARVELHRDMPWWARRAARAMIVPRGGARVRVHVRRDVPMTRALLAHEAYHVLQVQEHGWRFVAAYLALAVRYGFGRAHPLEAPAYEAGRRLTGARASAPTPAAALRALLKPPSRAAAPPHVP